ncbi:hypothetical protein AGR7C_Cc180025 [Agrobacterium deltaense Zutra 3/1]|uniref:Uncharacterized protein n=1 Tax=Agrobacterium deltaense Zutra 3/1 TaxID=1183427 RepID=A0A1S7PTK9_9HYPH|nr:hypothetical protein AGR7C_Cc180025 [Agrobacterium deltaense Zutra 3/1]
MGNESFDQRSARSANAVTLGRMTQWLRVLASGLATLDVILGPVPRIYPRIIESIRCRCSGQARA